MKKKRKKAASRCAQWRGSAGALTGTYAYYVTVVPLGKPTQKPKKRSRK